MSRRLAQGRWLLVCSVMVLALKSPGQRHQIYHRHLGIYNETAVHLLDVYLIITIISHLISANRFQSSHTSVAELPHRLL
ncbi:hypothetical protein K431DRAFT_25240 [Polychaeton citri CBS 116435]|uniref:DUF1746 domain-containing protein n=1 Tax=Polychaeton citri CBS 116435 TaxID=1314669 RepID=A0A9P4PYN1_9PEZI|nr:hypothetical protein K431DRAFT_25240 [Polychaeton citri CBS 116435]